jgi:hypothetical protein
MKPFRSIHLGWAGRRGEAAARSGEPDGLEPATGKNTRAISPVIAAGRPTILLILLSKNIVDIKP